MATVSTSESNTYLAHLIAEMIAMPNLPSDLRQALTEHLNRQLSMVNILKPEYCRRLYPILAELAELHATPDITTSVVRSEVSAPLEANGAYASDSISDSSGSL
jgi:hypothetical protein